MTISIDRIMQKLDEYFDKNDYMGAEKHLNYWFAEAELTNDDRALFFITNELIGFHRKQKNQEKALAFCEKALELAKKMSIENTVGAATSYINIATAYKAFEMAKEALPYFEKAKEIYEAKLEANDARLAGLYNNMGLALCDLKEFEEANALYRKAIEIANSTEDGALDAAITYLNMADAAEQEKGMAAAEEEISTYLEKAKSLLERQKESGDGYYAFVCEKCAPTFGYYGYFLYKKELTERAKEIYARN